MKEYKNSTFLILIASVIFIWIVGWIAVDVLNTTDTTRGTFGDKFGFVNSLFSGLALAGIVYSILLQQTELSLQRKELSDTREEFKSQNFQDTFFNLLKTQSQIANDLSAKIWYLQSYDSEVGVDYRSKEFFNQSRAQLKRILDVLESETYLIYRIWDQHEEHFNTPHSEWEADELTRTTNKAFTFSYFNISKSDWESYKQMQSREMPRIAYGIFFNKFHYVIGHYFRHIYHILNFLKTSEIEKIKDKKEEEIIEIKKEFKQYADFVQAQMSTAELFLLFYNSLAFPKLQSLLIYYNTLENLTIEDLIDKDHANIPGITLKNRSGLLK